MAGRGPAPKPADQRRNRSAKRDGDWVTLPAEGHRGAIPSLPRGLGITKTTREWWKAIWRTPMATQWTAGDVPALTELAVLRERLVVDGKVSVAPEVRLRSDQFGLTPKGRQERRWIITDEDAVRAGIPDELEKRRSRARRMKATDPKAAAP